MASDIIARGMAANAAKGSGGATYDLVSRTDAEGTVSYHLQANGEDVGSAIIMPDVENPDVFEPVGGTVKKCTEPNVPVDGYKVGDEYIDMVLRKTDSEDEKHVYMLVSELADTKAEKIEYDKSESSIIKATNVNDALNELGVLAGTDTNGMMSAYDKTKLDNMGTFKDDESMKLAIDGMFSGYDMSGLDPDDDDGIADHSDIADIFDNPDPTPPSSREPEVQGSFMSLSADEIDDILGGTTPTPDGSDDGDDEDLDSGDIDDILGI